jgi:hypothetical protein
MHLEIAVPGAPRKSERTLRLQDARRGSAPARWQSISVRAGWVARR